MNPEQGYIYFVGEKDIESGQHLDLVKIGLVKKVDERTSQDRLSEHQTGNPRELVLLHNIEVPAVSTIEKMLHKHYAKFNIRGEWFKFRQEDIAKALNTLNEYKKEIAENLEYFENANKLKDQESNDQQKKSNKEIDEIYYKYWENDFKLKVCLEINDKIKKQAFAIYDQPEAAVEAGIEKPEPKISEYVIKTPRKPSEKIDEDKLKENEYEKYNEFCITTFKIVQKFIPNQKHNFTFYIENIDLELSEFIKNTELIFGMQSSNIKFFEELNRYRMILSGYIAEFEWKDELYKNKLKNFCGLYENIENICTWRRVNKATTKFDTTEFKKKYPEIASKYTFYKENTTATSMKNKFMGN
jgi:hypothetical protein